jgi:hypothetical protein
MSDNKEDQKTAYYEEFSRYYNGMVNLLSKLPFPAHIKSLVLQNLYVTCCIARDAFLGLQLPDPESPKSQDKICDSLDAA